MDNQEMLQTIPIPQPQPTLEDPRAVTYYMRREREFKSIRNEVNAQETIGESSVIHVIYRHCLDKEDYKKLIRETVKALNDSDYKVAHVKHPNKDLFIIDILWDDQAWLRELGKNGAN